MKKKLYISVLNVVLLLLALVQIACIAWTILMKGTSPVAAVAPGADFAEKQVISQMSTTLVTASVDETELMQVKAELTAKLERLNGQLEDASLKKLIKAREEVTTKYIWSSVDDFLAVKDEYPEIYEYVKKYIEDRAKNRIRNRAQVLRELSQADISEKEYHEIATCFAAWDELDSHVELREYEASEMPLYPGAESKDAKEVYQRALKRWKTLLEGQERSWKYDRGFLYDPVFFVYFERVQNE